MARRRIDAWIHGVAIVLGARRPGDAPPALGADLQVASVRWQLEVRLVVRALFGGVPMACLALLVTAGGAGPSGRAAALALLAGAVAAAATALVQHAAVTHAGRPSWSPPRLAGAATAASTVILAAAAAQVGALLLTGEIDLHAQAAGLATLHDAGSPSVVGAALSGLIVAMVCGGAVGGAALSRVPAMDRASNGRPGWSAKRGALVMAGVGDGLAVVAVASLAWIGALDDEEAIGLILLAQVTPALSCFTILPIAALELLAVDFVEARLRRRRARAG